MKKITSVFIAFLVIAFFCMQSASAQLPIKIPRVTKPRPQPTSTETTQPPRSSDEQPPQPQPGSRNETKSSTAAQSSAVSEDQPTIAKDSVQVTARTLAGYKKNYEVWGWVPKINFRVNGPIASGSQLYVEFTIPAAGPWVKFDCKTEETQKGFGWDTECGGHDIPEEKSSIYTGPVNFTIRLRNELAGGDTTLFTGKMKVAKVHAGELGPNKFVYYVDHDWNLPIGYLFYEPDKQWDRDDARRWARPKFSFAFWTRGESSGFAEPHLFHGGKEVGKLYYEGKEVGTPSCGTTEVHNDVNQSTADGPKFIWQRQTCTFFNVLPWDKSGDKTVGLFGPMYLFSENPGDYEIKIIYQGHLIRSFRFAVDAEGKLVDNGIATANKLGSDRIIVPVQVIGDSDGPWDRNAWKDAFYGNPLKGFSVP